MESATLRMRQEARHDFDQLLELLLKKIPFTFVRFSDGEMEIIRNHRLFIGDGRISWSKGEVEFSYPDFDKKDFLPERDVLLRDDLIASARFTDKNFIKGIPASHNKALDDRNLLVGLNDGSHKNLTFADLFINQNYLKFRRKVLPSFYRFEHVFYLGNFRSKPNLLNDNWKLIPLQDNFFENYEQVLGSSLSALQALPKHSLVLSSASSLTNILGHQILQHRQDLTFFDVGTSLHDLVGLQSGIREYHVLTQKNSPRVIYKKMRLVMRKNFKLNW